MAKVVGNALPVGGVYNETPPTGENEHIIPLQVDEEGNLKVAGIASGASGLEYNATPPTLSDGGTDAVQGDVNGNTKVTEATLHAGEDLTNDVQRTEQRSSYLNMTTDTAVKSSAGRLFGIFVASASATPTIKIWDNTAGSGTVLINTFTPVAATYYTFPGVEFANGHFVDVGGTVDITVFYK